MTKVCKSIILLFICRVNSKLLYENDNLKQVEKCIQKTIDNFFDKDNDLIIFADDIDLNLSSITQTKIVSNISKFNVKNKVKSYLIIQKYTNIKTTIKYLLSLSSWNPKAKFFIICYDDDVKEILEICHQHFMVDTIILDVKELNFYTWNAQEVLCKNISNVVHLGRCHQDMSIHKSNNWEGCVLKIVAMNISPYVFKKKDGILDGIEIRGLKAIEENMGITLTFINHNFKTWGLRKTDGKYTDMFALLQKYEVDIVLGMWPTNYTHMWDFDVTKPYFQDALVWLVPKSKLQTQWKRMIKVFNKTLWISIITLTFINGILWKIISHFLQVEFYSFKDLQKCLLLSISVIFNVTIYKHPKTTTLRILFISWVCISLILVTIYQSKLISSLTQPQYEYQIENVEELLKSEMAFGGNINIKTLFNNSVTNYEKIIYENIEICDLTLDCPNRTAFSRDFATAKSEIPAKFLIMQYYTTPDGFPMIYIFKSEIMFHYVNMVFSYGHPLYYKFNEKLERLFEGGLFYKWLNDIKYEQMRYVFEPSRNKLYILTLDYMIAPFIVLFIGLLISLFTFLCELCIAKI